MSGINLLSGVKLTSTVGLEENDWPAVDLTHLTLRQTGAKSTDAVH